MRLYHFLTVTTIAVIPILAAACGGSHEEHAAVSTSASTATAAASEAPSLEGAVDRFAKAMAVGDMLAAVPSFSPDGMRQAMQLQAQAGGGYPTAATPAQV